MEIYPKELATYTLTRSRGGKTSNIATTIVAGVHKTSFNGFNGDNGVIEKWQK